MTHTQKKNYHLFYDTVATVLLINFTRVQNPIQSKPPLLPLIPTPCLKVNPMAKQRKKSTTCVGFANKIRAFRASERSSNLLSLPFSPLFFFFFRGSLLNRLSVTDCLHTHARKRRDGFRPNVPLSLPLEVFTHLFIVYIELNITQRKK